MQNQELLSNCLKNNASIIEAMMTDHTMAEQELGVEGDIDKNKLTDFIQDHLEEYFRPLSVNYQLWLLKKSNEILDQINQRQTFFFRRNIECQPQNGWQYILVNLSAGTPLYYDESTGIAMTNVRMNYLNGQYYI